MKFSSSENVKNHKLMKVSSNEIFLLYSKLESKLFWISHAIWYWCPYNILIHTWFGRKLYFEYWIIKFFTINISEFCYLIHACQHHYLNVGYGDVIGYHIISNFYLTLLSCIMCWYILFSNLCNHPNSQSPAIYILSHE